MILPIYAYGNPILRVKAKDVDPDEGFLKGLVSDMFETMKHANGVGLAAPQIGKSLRIFVVDASPFSQDESYSERERDFLYTFKRTFINPRIIEETGDEWNYEEGCLSIPNIREDISRQELIKLNYRDEIGNSKTEVFKGIVARIIQHEYDHLEGILFTDKISAFKRRVLKKKLENIQKGNIDNDFEMVFAK
ncbi:peptide deformylase [Elysia marginata]|uniref:Peptide deformylase n=1 Tax=Elysia marginata TaxID=1093978 RepID=A0AAV4FNI7_9GAST|nr:peptide deformylase [Elysia marginata]